MSTIEIHHTHSLDRTTARSAITHLVEQLAAQMPITTHWDSDILHFSGAGINGIITLEEGHVHIKATLGFLVSAMKEMVEQKIRNVLTDQLTGQKATPV